MAISCTGVRSTFIYAQVALLMMSNSFYTILLPITTNNRFKPTVQNKIMFFDSLNSYVFFVKQ